MGFSQLSACCFQQVVARQRCVSNIRTSPGSNNILRSALAYLLDTNYSLTELVYQYAADVHFPHAGRASLYGSRLTEPVSCS